MNPLLTSMRRYTWLYTLLTTAFTLGDGVLPVFTQPQFFWWNLPQKKKKQPTELFPDKGGEGKKHNLKSQRCRKAARPKGEEKKKYAMNLLPYYPFQ